MHPYNLTKYPFRRKEAEIWMWKGVYALYVGSCRIYDTVDSEQSLKGVARKRLAVAVILGMISVFRMQP